MTTETNHSTEVSPQGTPEWYPAFKDAAERACVVAGYAFVGYFYLATDPSRHRIVFRMPLQTDGVSSLFLRWDDATANEFGNFESAVYDGLTLGENP